MKQLDNKYIKRPKKKAQLTPQHRTWDRQRNKDKCCKIVKFPNSSLPFFPYHLPLEPYAMHFTTLPPTNVAAASCLCKEGVAYRDCSLAASLLDEISIAAVTEHRK